MTATIHQFIPKPNPRIRTSLDIGRLNRNAVYDVYQAVDLINSGWLTEEQMAEYKAPDKDET